MGEPQNEQDKREESENRQPPAPERKKRWLSRGMYGSRDVPIRALDISIGVMIAAVVILTAWFASHGGFVITFDTARGAADIPDQSVRHGHLVAEPETPVRPGYDLVCWWYRDAPWDFASSSVSGDMTLSAVWTEAEVTVKFDLDGGTFGESDAIPPSSVVYGEPYGALPQPKKPDFIFGGWIYSGELITAETAVTATGEHLLTAQWS